MLNIREKKQILKKDFRQKILPLILISFFIPLFVFGLVFLSQWKNLLDNEEYIIKAGIEDSLSDLGGADYDFLPEELYDPLVKYNFNNVADLMENVVIYDTDTDEYASDGDISEDLLERLEDDNTEAYISDGSYHIFYKYNNLIIHSQVSLDSIKTTLNKEAIEGLILLIAGFIVVSMLITIIYLVISSIKVRRFLFYAVIGIWVFLFAVLLSVPTGSVIRESQKMLMDKIYTISESLIEDIDEFIDKDVSENFAVGDSIDEDFNTYDKEHSIDSEYSELLAANLYHYADYCDYIDEIDYGENILDTSIPIEERITFIYDQTMILNKVLDLLLECIMMVMLALVLVRFFLMRLNQEFFVDKNDSEFKGVMRMHFLVLAKKFIDALTAVAFVPVLMMMIEADSLDNGESVTTWIIFGIGLMGVFIAILMPYVRRKVGHIIAFFRIGLTFSLFGAILCFISSNSLMYIVGYFILAFGDALASKIYILFPKEISDKEKGKKLTGFFSSGTSVGEIAGFVVSGLISEIFGNKNMFLFVGILLLVTLTLSFFLPKLKLENNIPLVLNFKGLIKNKKVIIFTILILVPYGFISYFFKYQIPIVIDSIGLTTTLISFVFFIRQFFLFFFGGSEKVNAFWKKFKPLTIITMSMFLIAVEFIVYCLFFNIIVLLVITILLAFTQTKLSGTLYTYNKKLSGDKDENFFILQLDRAVGNKAGSMVAPVITEYVGLITLPIIMIVFTLVNFFYMRKK